MFEVVFYNKSILIVKVFIRIALPDAPDSTQQVKRLVHQQQDSDAQNAIQSVTDRFFAGESEVHLFAVFEGGPTPPGGSVRRV